MVFVSQDCGGDYKMFVRFYGIVDRASHTPLINIINLIGESCYLIVYKCSRVFYYLITESYILVLFPRFCKLRLVFPLSV